MGPKMVAAAGAHADGVTLNYAASHDRVHEVITAAREAAERAGRDPETLRFPAHVLTTVDDDDEAAVERFRARLETMPVLRAESGLPDGTVSAQAAAELSASGNPTQVRQRLRGYLDAGATEVIVVAVENSLPALDAIFAGP
jgi:alkanesulfonate monooxygenase SsuD/methylene tetrahydromethanopterin reductase-like flavin-dependent oxidoreductase (luciferase family)